MRFHLFFTLSNFEKYIKPLLTQSGFSLSRLKNPALASSSGEGYREPQLLNVFSRAEYLDCDAISGFVVKNGVIIIHYNCFINKKACTKICKIKLMTPDRGRIKGQLG